MGAAAVAGGFIIIILVALIGLMIFIGLWIYRRRYLRNSPKSKMTLLLLNTSMVITITPGVMLIWSLIWVKIDNIFIEKSRLEAEKRRYIQLESPLSFGEIIIPQDSWVNLDTPLKLPIEELTDIRQGITKVRFSTTMDIIGFSAAAMEIVNEKLYLEMAEDMNYQVSGETRSCPQGWILKITPSENSRMTSRYEDQTGSWFTPSQWSADSCYQTTAAIIVLAVNDEYGVYALDHTPLSHKESL